MIKYSVGLDISSKSIYGCISSIDSGQRVTVKSTQNFPNTKAGFKSMDGWMRKHRKDENIPLVVCMEATGNYHESCALYLFEKGFSVSVVLPNKAKNYLRSLGHKSKNDSIDAKGLAQMGAEQCLRIWSPFGRFFYELRSLTRHHQSLQEQKTVVKNQLHALKSGMYSSKTVEKHLESMIKLIDRQLEQLDTTIKNHLQSEEEVWEKVCNICMIKGVGVLTTAILLAETNGFELFENTKQLVSYCGYDVIENQSGKHNGKTKISKKGNSRIRRAMFMPAFQAVTYQVKPFCNLFNRTFEKHGLKMKSYVAVQKKILTTIYALWKNNTAFNQEYQHQLSKEQELELPSPVSFEKAGKSSADQVGTTQGKHPSEQSLHASSPVS
ncbi:IS110 family transposase [Algoriphagus aquimarinus]|uniref:IS110 family transposase n=1 Tax=Algoriphagus aquimarinus TaxID=237018 RepID=A0A5C7A817_9BACT|nr:IS110 family transposase [Algoriphagus aquimarinus]TXE01387.1 IS110 family transposase [Algoriphagus aquimarinus]